MGSQLDLLSVSPVDAINSIATFTERGEGEGEGREGVRERERLTLSSAGSYFLSYFIAHNAGISIDGATEWILQEASWNPRSRGLGATSAGPDQPPSLNRSSTAFL